MARLGSARISGKEASAIVSGPPPSLVKLTLAEGEMFVAGLCFRKAGIIVVRGIFLILRGERGFMDVDSIVLPTFVLAIFMIRGGVVDVSFLVGSERGLVFSLRVVSYVSLC